MKTTVSQSQDVLNDMENRHHQVLNHRIPGLQAEIQPSVHEPLSLREILGKMGYIQPTDGPEMTKQN
jgi:hypothetical protein